MLASTSVGWGITGHGGRRKGFGRVRVATGDSRTSEAVADDYYSVLGLVLYQAFLISSIFVKLYVLGLFL